MKLVNSKRSLIWVNNSKLVVNMKNKCFSQHENDILSLYRNGKYVEESHKYILEIYAGIGFVSFGFDWDEMKETAKLTELGFEHSNR